MKFACSLLLVLSFVLPHAASAQDANSNEDLVENTRNDLLMVAGGGVVGAVLGLSTLSFYDKPSKHVSNIWTGAAVGIIGGVIVVALGHAQKTQENLTSYSPKMTPDFSSAAREEWHFANIAKFSPDSSLAATPIWGTAF
jgi:hypothetical protein